MKTSLVILSILAAVATSNAGELTLKTVQLANGQRVQLYAPHASVVSNVGKPSAILKQSGRGQTFLFHRY